MPPKRKTPAATTPKPRASKLARENNISASEELEIKECFALFRSPDSEEEVMKTSDVRRGMIALNIPPAPSELKDFLEVLDPENSGYTDFPSFLSICALKMRARDNADEEDVSVEVEDAFRLMKGGGEGPITVNDLRRVARVLNEDVSEEMLRDMILEGNGGGGVSAGVGLEAFEGIMRRVGVLK